MDTRIMWYVITSVVLMVLVGQTRALSCYICASSIQGHEKCGEDTFVPTSAAVLHNCTVCKMSVHAINTVSVVQRQCVKDCTPQTTDEQEDSVAARLTVKCCRSDMCNSAPVMSMTVMTGVCTVMAVLGTIRLL